MLAVAIAVNFASNSEGQVGTAGGGGGGGGVGGGTTGGGGGAGGHYFGPNDTLPPNIGGGCDPTVCPTPCGPAVFPLDLSCDSLLPMTFGTVLWQGPCGLNFYNKNAFFRQINIQDLKAWCSQPAPANGVVDVCMDVPCISGALETCIYTAIPFRWYPGGLQDGNGNCFGAPLCGLKYDFAAVRQNNTWFRPTCTPDFDGCGVNDTRYSYTSCQKIKQIVIQFDPSCFCTMLTDYQTRGLYSPTGFDANGNPTYLSDTSAVFVVLHRCCDP